MIQIGVVVVAFVAVFTGAAYMFRAARRTQDVTLRRQLYLGAAIAGGGLVLIVARDIVDSLG